MSREVHAARRAASAVWTARFNKGQGRPYSAQYGNQSFIKRLDLPHTRTASDPLDFRKHRSFTASGDGDWRPRLMKRIGRCLQWGCTDQQLAAVAALLYRTTGSNRAALHARGFGCQESKAVSYRVQDDDLDAGGFVKGSVYARLAEDTRQYHMPFLSDTAEDEPQPQFIVRSNFKVYGLARFPDTLNIFYNPKAYDPVQKRVTIVHNIFSSARQQLAAKLTEHISYVDSLTGDVVSPPDSVITKFEELSRQSLLNQTRGWAEIEKLHDRVQRLERSTWDRPDAVEDMGSAAGGAVSDVPLDAKEREDVEVRRYVVNDRLRRGPGWRAIV